MKNTNKLKSDLSKLEADTSELEDRVNSVDDSLIYVHDKLAIPETLHDRLSTLDSNLKLASDLLGVMRIIPPISAAASNTKKVIDLFREPVAKARKVSGDIDKRVKPIRTKVHQVEQQVAQLDAELKSVIAKEQGLIQSANHAQVCIMSLPSGSVKTDSSAALETLSGKADPPVVRIRQTQHVVLEVANEAESKINQLKKHVQSLLEIDAAIDRVMKVLDPLIRQLQAIKKAFNKMIRVPYGALPKMCTKKTFTGIKVHYPCGWYPVYFSFSIQQILNGVTGVIKPVMDLLDKAMNAVLNPLLKALDLNIKLPAIPGLDKLKDIIDSLTSVFDPMTRAFDRLVNEVQALQARLQSLFEFADEYHKIYQACVHGKAEQTDRAAPMPVENQAELDPDLFDAMVTLGERTYMFRGDTYWLHASGQEEAEGPFPISSEFGSDDNGRPMTGPFDAACVIDNRVGLFQGKHYYLCTPGENASCRGPLEIEGRWGKIADGQLLSGPVDAAFSYQGRTYLFQKDQFFISTPGDDAHAQGPFPIKGLWGLQDQDTPLSGPFDAVCLYASRLYIRKKESFWDLPLNKIKALN
jgi:hypothetical protein